MKFGLCFAISGREPIGRAATLAADAERLGFDNVWFIDSPLVAKDVYVTLTLAASATTRLRIGTGVTVVQLRHPVATASAACTLAELSGGRFELGLGAGDSAVKPIGLPVSKVDDLALHVQAMQGLMRGEQTALAPDGTHSVRVAAAPQPVPVLVAAGLPRMLEMAGRVADGVIVMGPNRPEWMSWQIEQILAGAASVGRTRDDLFIDLWTTISVSDDRAQATEDIKPWVAAQARSLPGRLREAAWLAPHRDELERASQAYDFSHHLSRGAPHGSTVSDELARDVAIAGNVEECVQRLARLVELAPDRITMTLLPGGRDARMRVLGEEVLPALAARAPAGES
ncbi:MAG TPA: LLM class flavin-dependent oxidoreductase [Acidimicrobiales bacterium]|nr:LLM class flavin-dependent oxidoreductase [Acidimicrobiales bacterium]